MNVEADRATFTWSSGPASFKPYTLDGMVYRDFQEIALEARSRLADLVQDHLFDEQTMRASAFALARSGHELYQAMFQPSAEEARQARQVRDWLEQLAGQHQVDTLEIVVESPWSLSWNTIYDREPDEAAFLSGDDHSDCWKPFWGLRYNLAGGRKVDPLRRMPLLKDPSLLMVVDTDIRDGLPDEQQRRLAEFVESHDLVMVHNKEELHEAIRTQRPDLLYWLSHANADQLVLAGESISPRNLRRLLRQDGEIRFGGLAFLNACQTAERGESSSFFEAFHSVGFAGMIGTEHRTIDQFANPLGLDFLEAFLDRGEPVGAVLRELRGRVPLGLLYGTYCPPEIRVDRGNATDELEILQVRAQGVALGTANDRVAPIREPLPDEPYPSLAYYERKDRALFAGRDEDTERFATMLDDAETRILILHGESGVGKSSFLNAGVIPYLEEECLGYRFLRDRHEGESDGSRGSVIFIRATNDLFGQLAQTLCAYCARTYEYQTPLGETVSADLPGVLQDFVGDIPGQAKVRELLRASPASLGKLLAAISKCLPFTAILVIDQGEEVFTLAKKTAEDQQLGRQSLDMLRQTIDASGDFKLIFALRTEYYGRVIDRLRQGLHDVGSIREYLLTDIDEPALVEAIRRPTSDEPIPHAAEIPAGKYGFRYGEGVAAAIASRLVRYSISGRDGVLPLMQVICSQLYCLASKRADKTVSLTDLDNLGGIEGGMRNHVETMVTDLIKERPRDKTSVQKLFTDLYLKQADGTLTTALLAEDKVRETWTGKMPFDELLKSSCERRLLKVNSLRIGTEDQKRYVSLGHDAIAKIAEEWDRRLSLTTERLKWGAGIILVVSAALVMAAVAWSASEAKRRAERAEAKATRASAVAETQKEVATHGLIDLLNLFLQIPKRGGEIASATNATVAKTAYTKLQRDVRIDSESIQKITDDIGLLVDKWKGENEATPYLRQRILELVKETKRAWESRTEADAEDGVEERAMARNELETERRILERELITKRLCSDAINVTQAMVESANQAPDGLYEKLSNHRAEFERLFWAELYWVELDEKGPLENKKSPLESAMMAFRGKGLQNWDKQKLDAVSPDTLQPLADEVRRCCENLMSPHP
jgi:hypothetical protein